MPRIRTSTPNGMPVLAGFSLQGESATGPGLVGLSTSREAAVFGSNTNGPGVAGGSVDRPGVSGGSVNVEGVRGRSLQGPGVSGGSVNAAGVRGQSVHGCGVQAWNSESRFSASLGCPDVAGDFLGDIRVRGRAVSTEGGSFRIDHPLDPGNRYLAHSSVASAERKTLYDGVAVLDAQGEAAVQLPAWLDTLNEEFRYQLTCIGGSAPVFIAREIEGNTFAIAGGRPGLKVSWQVTGIRKDAWAGAHPLAVEEDKPIHERGLLLFPTLL